MKTNDLKIAGLMLFEFAMGFAAAWCFRKGQYHQGKADAYEDCRKTMEEMHNQLKAKHPEWFEDDSEEQGE